MWWYEADIDAKTNLLGNYTEEEVQLLFNAIDTNNSGSISSSEFKAAFTPKDTKEKSWQLAILQRILSVLLENKIAVRSLKLFRLIGFQLSRVFKAFDQDCSGLVGPREFKAGLQALNIFAEEPLTDAQINILHDFIDVDKDGCISYQEFLDAFTIEDKGNKEKLKSIEALF